MTAGFRAVIHGGELTAGLSMAAIVDTLRTAGCVFAEEEAQLLVAEAHTPADIATLVGRRAAGVPLEQVLGWAEFCGLRIAVEPGVFVPRRRTEFLVSQAVALTGPDTVVVDLCCGSGAVAASLLAFARGVEVYAVDVDPTAVRCARGNLGNVGGEVYQGDLYAPLPDRLRGRVGVLVANAPYVPTSAIAAMPPEARDHEPLAALDGGDDGLDLLRRVSAEAKRWLAPGGHLLVETSRDQARRIVEIMAGHGLVPRVTRSDDLGATVAIGTWPAVGPR